MSGLATADARGAVTRALERHQTRPGALLPVLHDVQHELGYADLARRKLRQAR
jgi:NADH:ubiquinone oxidoreductase subunit E